MSDTPVAVTSHHKMMRTLMDAAYHARHSGLFDARLDANTAGLMVDRLLANPDLVLAALIESGWTPTDDDLRMMGLELQTGYEHVITWRFLKEAESDAG